MTGIYTQQDLINYMTPVLKKYPITRGGLFGSYARHEQAATSDVDLIIDKTPDTAIGILNIIVELEDLLGIPVDIIFYSQLESQKDIKYHGSFRDRVKNEVIWFYEA